MAFDTIDRPVTINQDSEIGKKLEVKGKIEFRDVNFSYPSRLEQTILNDLSIDFEVGKTTAIVGPSGSGKSTIVQLIQRFYDPTSGDVHIDGEQLNRVNLREYRR